MHLITEDNSDEAADAIRDILMTYVQLADGCEGFSHNADLYIRFDPLRFVDAETDGKSHYVDLELLRSGSAMAIVCWYYNMWSEEQHLRITAGVHFEVALEAGRLAASPDIEMFLREALSRDKIPTDDPWFMDGVASLYRTHVLGFFRRLASLDRSVR